MRTIGQNVVNPEETQVVALFGGYSNIQECLLDVLSDCHSPYAENIQNEG